VCINKNGVTRVVFIFKRHVLKLPTLKRWDLFLNGLLANMQERDFGMTKTPAPRFPYLCPVRHASRLGFWLVMDKASPASEQECADILDKIKATPDNDLELAYDFYLSDSKQCNWGVHPKYGIVKIDYGE
jgi:hypothetical protein